MSVFDTVKQSVTTRQKKTKAENTLADYDQTLRRWFSDCVPEIRLRCVPARELATGDPAQSRHLPSASLRTDRSKDTV